jgi:hypothetical protein
MNGIIVFSNKDCPAGTTKLSENVVFMDKNIDDKLFRKSDSLGLDNLQITGLEPRILTMCQYPRTTAQKQIPKGSYFTVKDATCPVNSSNIGKIGILDQMGQNNEYWKIRSYISDIGGSYYNYSWKLPTMCRADNDVDINKDIVLPSTNCNRKTWTDVGTFGMLGSVFDYSFYEDVNNIAVDPVHRFLPDQQIILPKMCAGFTNETIKRCAKSDPVYKNKCDEEMRELCKTSEFGDDNICSCINSRIKLIGNPLCISGNCVKNGYKTYEMLANEHNFFQKTGLINCEDLYGFMLKHPEFEVVLNRFTNHCFNDKAVDPQIPKIVDPVVKTNYVMIILISVAIIFFIILFVFFVRRKIK